MHGACKLTAAAACMHAQCMHKCWNPSHPPTQPAHANCTPQAGQIFSLTIHQVERRYTLLFVVYTHIRHNKAHIKPHPHLVVTL
jgi:hypothetical protein